MSGADLSPIATQHTSEWHQQKIAEFTLYKSWVGEPSPHMTVAGWMSRDVDTMELIWRAGCYAAPYSILTSEAIWREWPWERVRDDPAGLEDWVRLNWLGFHIRTERRMVRTAVAMTRCLLSYRAWMLDELPGLPTPNSHHWSPKRIYAAWWDSILGSHKTGQPGVHNFGRYITIRLLEFFNRYLPEMRGALELTDVRAIDPSAHSPIRCLAMLYQDHAYPLLTLVPGVADVLAERLLVDVQKVAPATNHYVLAAMLCEYRVAYERHHQYPGRTIDQELHYQQGSAAAFWNIRGFKTDIWEARRQLFPVEALGEINGWKGIRKEPEQWLSTRGQNWSDLLYTYPSGEPRLTRSTSPARDALASA